MKCYVVEVKEIRDSNYISNQDGLASVRLKTATHDVLCYAAPLEGDYVRAHALMADDIISALSRAREALSQSADQQST